MKTLEWVLENYNNLETVFDTRLGRRRLLPYLTEEQLTELGLELKDEYKGKHVPTKEWTEENIVEELRGDTEFGIEKATRHRGISASLMWEVCMAWCTVLENGLDEEYKDDYGYYGDKLFKAIDGYYNFGLVDKDTFGESFYEEW